LYIRIRTSALVRPHPQLEVSAQMMMTRFRRDKPPSFWCGSRNSVESGSGESWVSGREGERRKARIPISSRAPQPQHNNAGQLNRREGNFTLGVLSQSFATACLCLLAAYITLANRKEGFPLVSGSGRGYRVTFKPHFFLYDPCPPVGLSK
jgi:hypothetical protein